MYNLKLQHTHTGKTANSKHKLRILVTLKHTLVKNHDFKTHSEKPLTTDPFWRGILFETHSKNLIYVFEN